MKRILAIFVCMLLALPVLGIAEETASGGDLIVGGRLLPNDSPTR